MKEPSAEKREVWASVVGKLILNFGSAENVTNLLLLQWCRDEILVQAMFDYPFAKRLHVLKQVVERQGLERGQRTSLLAAIAQISKLSEIRNIVAHNPLIIGSSGSHEFVGIPRFKKKGRMFEGVLPTLSLRAVGNAVTELLQCVDSLSAFIESRPPLVVQMEQANAVRKNL